MYSTYIATLSETLYLDPILWRLNIYYGYLIWKPLCILGLHNIYSMYIVSIILGLNIGSLMGSLYMYVYIYTICY